MTNMSVDSLKTNLTNPARAYLWEVMIPNPPVSDTETLLLRCRTASIPEKTIGKIHIPYKQTAGVEFAGKATNPHTISLGFIESEDRDMLDAFHEWISRVVDDKTGSAVSNYKFDMYLHLQNTDGSVGDRLKFVGCWPEGLGGVDLSHDSESEIVFAVTFSYDRWDKL